MYKHFSKILIVLMVILSVFSVSCELNVEKSDSPVIEDNILRIPALAISRVYIAPEGYGQVKFFAVTNTGDSNIDLSPYSFAIDKTVHDKVQSLPKAVLGKGKTLFCINGFLADEGNEKSLKKFSDMFPEISSLKEYSGEELICEDMIWFGILGWYKGESSMEIVTDIKGDTWTTLDEVVVGGHTPRKPSAFLRNWSCVTGEDLGWYVLSATDDNDIYALDTGKYEGDSVRPNVPESDDSDPWENGKPDLGGDEVPNPNYPSGNGRTTAVDNVMLGYPDSVTFNDPKGENHYLVTKDSYVLSYNNSAHNPNWVSWHLTSEDMGNNKRYDCYHPEEQLPNSWAKVGDEHYAPAGYSRGHMCPNGERNGDRKMQDDTFSMANMVPQGTANNSGPWNQLENVLRSKCEGNKEAYIVAGPYGKIRNHVKNGMSIVIPEYTWKVALVIDKGSDDLMRINNGSSTVEAIAIWMPNENSRVHSKDHRSYGVSIDYVEQMTGYDFFAFLDDEEEALIEGRVYGR